MNTMILQKCEKFIEQVLNFFNKVYRTDCLNSKNQDEWLERNILQKVDIVSKGRVNRFVSNINGNISNALRGFVIKAQLADH
ncbi:MAG TPA: hypothetical protein GX503_06795 [Clostridiales bacterium]|nr:hypothetical protein [Clostridiales bacterium]